MQSVLLKQPEPGVPPGIVTITGASLRVHPASPTNTIKRIDINRIAKSSDLIASTGHPPALY
jgi:hypothetical protein